MTRDDEEPGPGLCARCRHARRVETSKGSEFVLCELSRTDDRFARYPRLPVRTCDGFEEGGRLDRPSRDG